MRSQVFSFSGCRNMAQSNFDRRRINGPEESFPPVFSDEEETFVKPGAPRNGRGAKEIRPICTSHIQLSELHSRNAVLKPGLISQANGSAYIETEKTKIACAVYVHHQVDFPHRLSQYLQIWTAAIQKHNIQREGTSKCRSQVHTFLLRTEESPNACKNTYSTRQFSQPDAFKCRMPRTDP